MLRKLMGSVLAVLCAGVACALSTAWPMHFGLTYGSTVWWLQWGALAVLCTYLPRCVSMRRAFFLGGLFATAWLTTTFWWLYVAMHTYAGLPAALAALAVLLLAGALALYYAAVCAVYWRWARTRPVWASMAFASLWTLAEMARGIWFTGFGWGAVGYAQLDGPLAGWIPWVGAYGVGWLTAWVSVSLVLWRRASWLQRGTWVLVLVAPVLLPPTWSHPAGSLSVSLLQGNIAQDQKFEAGTGVPQALQWYAQQLQASRSALVVTPETAVPLLPEQLPVGYLEALQGRFSTGTQAALLGTVWGDGQQGYSNSVLGFAPGQSQPWRYDKHHLVPFGEFIPPMFQWFIAMMNIPLGDFQRGAVGQPSFAWGGQRLATNICYEDMFGEELAARFVDAALAPTVLVNVSNIAWFGDTVVLPQHVHIARMRTLEFSRPTVRATNTGATLIMDHQGRVTDALPAYTRGVLEGVVHGRTGITPYAWWASRWGLWPLWGWSLVLCMGVAYVVRRERLCAP